MLSSGGAGEELDLREKARGGSEVILKYLLFLVNSNCQQTAALQAIENVKLFQLHKLLINVNQSQHD